MEGERIEVRGFVSRRRTTEGTHRTLSLEKGEAMCLGAN
jgi:hypothetical protein